MNECIECFNLKIKKILKTLDYSYTSCIVDKNEL